MEEKEKKRDWQQSPEHYASKEENLESLKKLKASIGNIQLDQSGATRMQGIVTPSTPRPMCKSLPRLRRPWQVKDQDESTALPRRGRSLSDQSPKARVLTPRPRTPLVSGENVRTKAKQPQPASRSALPRCIGSVEVREARKALDEAGTVAEADKAKRNLDLAREKATRFRIRARYASPLDRPPVKRVWKYLGAKSRPSSKERCRYHPRSK